MAVYTNLISAAQDAFVNCAAKTGNGQLKSALSDFVAAVNQSPQLTGGTFPDQAPNNRPISNWFIPIVDLSSGMSATAQYSLLEVDQAANLVYRICWAAFAAAGPPSNTQGPGLIDTAQYAAMLAAYNASIA